MPAPTCCYVLQPARLGEQGIYCGSKVGYKNVRDDDNNLVRKYNSFCDEHQCKIDKYKWSDEDEQELANL